VRAPVAPRAPSAREGAAIAHTVHQNAPRATRRWGRPSSCPERRPGPWSRISVPVFAHRSQSLEYAISSDASVRRRACGTRLCRSADRRTCVTAAAGTSPGEPWQRARASVTVAPVPGARSTQGVRQRRAATRVLRARRRPGWRRLERSRLARPCRAPPPRTPNRRPRATRLSAVGTSIPAGHDNSLER
jgi:hypothetical protein